MPLNNNIPSFKWQSVYLAYGVVMFFILLVGFFGNLLTIIVLRQRDHRKMSVAPLMMNIAIADLLIIIVGYPVTMSNNLKGDPMRAGSPYCNWSAFINSTTGMASIATLTALSGVVYQTVKRNAPNSTASKRQSTILIAGSWFYGFLTSFPPLLGWNRFVPGKAGFSCGPDWAADDSASVTYIVLLITVGFFAPLILIMMFHYFTYRLLKRPPVAGDPFIQARRKKYKQKLAYMAMAITSTFLLSWSPYAIVSLTATIKGRHVLTSGEAEIPELMAKASVIYNPIVYTIMNERFRRTLWVIISGNGAEVAPDGSRNGTDNLARAAEISTNI
ncbi:melanopsin-like [Oculina patagonica]